MCEFCFQDHHLPSCPYAAEPAWECTHCGELVYYKIDGVPLHEECEYDFYLRIAMEYADDYLEKTEQPELYYQVWWFNNLPADDRMRLLLQMYATEETVFADRMADDRRKFVREQEDSYEFGKELYDRLL